MNDISDVLSCESLSKSFVDGDLNVDVFSDLSFSVEAGAMVAITGASGSGKSTLLHLLGGLDKPTGGRVSLMGVDIKLLSEVKKAQMRNKHLGFVYQFHHLLPEFSAIENVCMPLLIRGESFSSSKKKALALIDQVGLADRCQHRVGELSGGERQRIAIARALVTQPDCVLADEPTGNLDIDTAEHVFDLMLDLNRNNNTSFVVVTHNLQLAQKLDRIFTINKGSLTEG
jgi:lipoprotein-releasing system ATP-binding protein